MALSPVERLEHAFNFAKDELNIEKLLDPEGKKKKKDVHVSAYKHTPFDVTNQKGPTHQPYTYKLATHVNWQTKTFLITLLSLDVAVQLPDKKSILMYVTSLFAVLPNDVTMDDIREVETLPRKYKVDEGHPASTQVNRRKR